jgi:5-methylcytosine-specific restriction enzyme subunit McrC
MRGDTDFIEMYVRALQFAPSSEYFSKCYGIDLDQPAIECPALNEQLTPLLIVHYLAVLKKIVSHGLKKDYVIREENLHSKMRGRIMLQKNLQKNIFVQRQDRVFCRFQEYTVDTIENRLLKKALVFSDSFLSRLASQCESLSELKRIIG